MKWFRSIFGAQKRGTNGEKDSAITPPMTSSAGNEPKIRTCNYSAVEASQPPSPAISVAALDSANHPWVQPMSIHYLFADKSEAISMAQTICDATSLPPQRVKLSLWDMGSLADHDVLYYEPINDPKYALTFTFEQVHSADFDKWKATITNVGFLTLKDRLGSRFSVLKNPLVDTELSQLKPGDPRVLMLKDLCAHTHPVLPDLPPEPQGEPEERPPYPIIECRPLIWDMQTIDICSYPVLRDWKTDYGKGLRMFPTTARRLADGVIPCAELLPCELSESFRSLSLREKVKSLTKNRPQTYLRYTLIDEEYTTLNDGSEAAYLEYKHNVEGEDITCYSMIACSNKYICNFTFKIAREDLDADWYHKERIIEFLKHLEIN